MEIQINEDVAPVRIFLNAKQAADMLGLEPSTLANWRSEGKGPKFHKFGGAVRYSRNDLLAWASQQ